MTIKFQSEPSLTGCIVSLDHIERMLGFAEQQITACKEEILLARKMVEDVIQHHDSIDSASTNSTKHGNNSNAPFLTLDDIVKRLGVTRQTIWHMRKAGNFPDSIKYTDRSKKIHFRPSDIEEWLESR